MRVAVVIVCLVLVVSCSRNTGEGHDFALGKACSVSADCPQPYVCGRGVCTFDVWCNCAPAETACVGEYVGTCREDCSDYDLTAAPCEHGCLNGACRPPVCAADERRCDDTLILVCNASGSAFETETECAHGCETTMDGVACRSVPDAGSP